VFELGKNENENVM